MIRIRSEGYRVPNRALMRLLRKIAGQLNFKGDVTIRLAGVDEVRALNKKYRHHDRVTDVLSFSCAEKLPGGFYAGDILICWPEAEKQALANRHSLAREMLLLMIHGLLHLHGLDHEKDKGEMLTLQQQLFAAHAKELE